MKNKDENKVDRYKEIIVFGAGCLLQVIIFAIGNYAGAVFSAAPLEAITLSVIVIAIGGVCWIVVRLFICKFLLIEKHIKKEACESLNNEVDETIEQCEITDDICCLKSMLTSHKFYLSIDEDIKNKFKLYDSVFVGEVEGSGIWKNIWVFSDDLSTELVSQERAETVVLANIANSEETKYCFFYIDGSQASPKQQEVSGRRSSMLKSLTNPDDKKRMEFCPLNVQTSGYIGHSTLPLLCGSVLFSSRAENGFPVFDDGYLPIRNNNDEQPLYYKLPRCMLFNYAQYFIEKYNQRKEA